MTEQVKEVKSPEVLHNEERIARQRKRSIAIGLGLAGLVLIFYVLTIVKMGPEIFARMI